jgi:hypothetical protein
MRSVALLVLFLALATGDRAFAQSRPSATGKVWAHHARPLPEFDFFLSFRAYGGDRVQGRVLFQVPTLNQWFVGSVNACFDQSGNLAVFGGTIAASRNLVPSGYFQIGVRDAGTNTNEIDLVKVEVGADQPTCSPVLSLASANPVTSGDLQVAGQSAATFCEQTWL